jgi:WhiB family transcriptional regulator, redox-sensing transcriptional regulator
MNRATGGGAWRSAAACADLGPTIFYDPMPSSVRAAKAVCGRCPVSAECLGHAVANGEQFGIWGGRAEAERAMALALARPSRGPYPAISDGQLVAVLKAADPQVLAIEAIRRRFGLKPDAAYKCITRAMRLGLVVRHGRNVYPAGPCEQV